MKPALRRRARLPQYRCRFWSMTETTRRAVHLESVRSSPRTYGRRARNRTFRKSGVVRGLPVSCEVALNHKRHKRDAAHVANPCDEVQVLPGLDGQIAFQRDRSAQARPLVLALLQRAVEAAAADTCCAAHAHDCA